MENKSKNFKRPEDQMLVIFGANGDLAKRKLIPAIFQLYLQALLPTKFIMLGTGRAMKDDEAFKQDVAAHITDFVKLSDAARDKIPGFLSLVRYQKLVTQESQDYVGLKERIVDLCQQQGMPKNVIYYFSTPPFIYEIISKNLALQSLNLQGDGWKRIVVEKPFGYSYATALELDRKLKSDFEEKQIYRIDHYLGKETVQNIFVARFANGFFEPIWNRRYVDRVEIISAETLGVGSRGGYYDTSGALRDMVQNHLLQVLSVIAMEPTAIFDAESIRTEKSKVFQAMRPIQVADMAAQVVRAQYCETEKDGKFYKGYRQEEGVDPASMTETFVAMKLFIDNWRWGDVPFYIRTGKRLPQRVTEVIIHLKPAPHQLFKQRCVSQSSNMIVLRIQPDEGMAMEFGMKVPGAGFNVQNVNMDFHYSDLTNVKIPEAYERLLLDGMLGDATLYARGDAVETTWKFVDPILNAWQEPGLMPMYEYDSFTWGPTESQSIFGHSKLKWRLPNKKFKT